MGVSNLIPGEVEDSGGELHFVVALNNFYAASTINQEFGDIFTGFDEASLIAAAGVLDNQSSFTEEEIQQAVGLLFSFSDFVNAANGDFLIGEGFTLVAFSMGQAIGTGTATATPGVAAVPEPATWALLIGGFGLVGTAMRRRRVTTVLA
ncbi:PEP-CTERM sorting domain-containing protein [Glacieibacterium frigidum]|uniref:PEP-CTERM sorting domain-containing protein n=2 Tax=Glacieibacterium frigidum TaxID=2593303 RepID=A0A552UAN6_9SPHN|nr:PEP-CTERM sorting domain-containing protein [Glacieibacterium frigidum]